MDNAVPKSRRKLWLIAAVFVVLAFGGILTFAVSQSRHQNHVAILPDGSRIEVIGSVTGTNSFTTERPWQRLARRILPARFQNRIPNAMTFQGGPRRGPAAGVGSRRLSPAEISNSVTIFFNFQPSEANVRDGRGAIQLYFHAEAVDDADLLGREIDLFTVSQSTFSAPASARPAGIFLGILFQAVPRRRGDFELHLLGETNGPLATLSVPTPPHRPFPIWKPRPLPQSITNGSFALTLQRLDQGGSPQKPQINCIWDFQSAPPGWTNVQIDPVTFSDATGNVGTNLSFREPAWLVHTQVRREWISSNPPPEKLVVSNLVVPVASHFTAINRGTNFGDMRLNVKLIAGAGEIIYHADMFTNGAPPLPYLNYRGGWSVPAPSPYLLVDVSSGYADGDVAFRLIDQDGHAVGLVPGPGDGPGSQAPAGYSFGTHVYNYNQGQRRATTRSDRLYQLNFAPDTSVTLVTLEVIALRRADEFEFKVDPRSVKPASTASRP